jgi:hypothetical protein
MNNIDVYIAELYADLNNKKLRVTYKGSRNKESLSAKIPSRNLRIVARVKNLKFEIYPNDHGLPHFHVTTDKKWGKFLIDNLEMIDGNFVMHEKSKIKRWADKKRDMLLEVWNNSRPCVIELPS